MHNVWSVHSTVIQDSVLCRTCVAIIGICSALQHLDAQVMLSESDPLCPNLFAFLAIHIN